LLQYFIEATPLLELYMKIAIPVIAFCALLISITPIPPKKGMLIQFNIDKLLNARPVTTFTNNKLTPWTKGIDGNGLGDGYFTLSAALFNGDKEPHALPDGPLFAANATHPAIKLHYSNTDSLHKQACAITGVGEAKFDVPRAKYSSVYLALTSAEGASSIRVWFNYIDGAECKGFTVPDYYWDIKADDTDFCYLAHDLAKWGNKNNMTEKDHHNIDLLTVHPDSTRVLKSVGIAKTKPGYLVFWAGAGMKKD
jgi:hypothetical protein